MNNLKNLQAIITNNNQQMEKKHMVSPVSFTKESEYYQKKSPDEKEYLIFYYATDDNGDEYKSFELITGRKEAYEWIKSAIDFIDIDESRILVEGVNLENAVTIYDFLKYVKAFYYDDGFDVDEYIDNKSTENNYFDNAQNNISFGMGSTEAYNLFNKVTNDMMNEQINQRDISLDHDDDENNDDDIYV